MTKETLTTDLIINQEFLDNLDGYENREKRDVVSSLIDLKSEQIKSETARLELELAAAKEPTVMADIHRKNELEIQKITEEAKKENRKDFFHYGSFVACFFFLCCTFIACIFGVAYINRYFDWLIGK